MSFKLEHTNTRNLCENIFMTRNLFHFQKIRKIVIEEVIPKSKMHEFHTIDEEDTMKQFKHRIEGKYNLK